MPITLNIRYQAPGKRIQSKIPVHYKQLTERVKQQHGIVDAEPLMQYIGVTKKRFTAILTGTGEPTLGEADRYAQYFQIDIKELYSPIPFKTKKQKV